MLTLSQWMTLGLVAALVALSARAAMAPRAAALAFGIRLPDGIAPSPFLAVKADRDFVLAALLVVVTFASHSILAVALFVGAIAPAADAWIVGHHGKLSATAVHLTTATYIVVAGVLAAFGH